MGRGARGGGDNEGNVGSSVFAQQFQFSEGDLNDAPTRRAQRIRGADIISDLGRGPQPRTRLVRGVRRADGVPERARRTLDVAIVVDLL